MYYTQEKLALQTLERICALARPAFGLWVHLSCCPQWNERTRHTQVILNLLAPLTTQRDSRIFIFKNTDILCLGIETPLPLINNVWGQIQTLLAPYATDPIGQVFNLPADKTMLINRLFPQQVPSLWDNTPYTTEMLLTRQALVCQQNGNLTFHFWLGPHSLQTQQNPYPLWQRQLKDYRPDLKGYWGTVVDMNEQEEFLPPLVLGADIHAALNEPQAYRDFRARYVHHPIALCGLSPNETDYFDLTNIPFDYLFWPIQAPCPYADNTKIIKTSIQTQEQLEQALTQGYHYFMGPFVQILTAMQYKKTCPFGQDCTLPVCTGALLSPIKDKKCICPDHLNQRN